MTHDRGPGGPGSVADRPVLEPAGPAVPSRAAPLLLPPLLVLAAVPFLRPNLLGEGLAVVGLGLSVAAALLAVLWRERIRFRGELGSLGRNRVLLVLLASAAAWPLARAAAAGSTPALRVALQDLGLVVGTTAAVVVVCRDRRAARWLARAFVLVIAALCASYVITVLIWAVYGIGAGQIGTAVVGDLEPQPLYLPLTVSYSQQTVLGVALPRFTGLGRESGWMAMYCAVAYFLAPAVGMRRRVTSVLLVIGLLGCLSTAGFGVFVVVWAYDTFVRPRSRAIEIGSYLRQLAGVAVVGVAAWIAVAAPVLGLAAKRTQNELSLDERARATAAGWRALTTSPWGGTSSSAVGSVNLVADIAVNGLPFVVLVLAALLVPPLLAGGAGHSTAVCAVIVLTLLLAQPAAGSSWVFCLVAVALAVDDGASATPVPGRDP